MLQIERLYFDIIKEGLLTPGPDSALVYLDIGLALDDIGLALDDVECTDHTLCKPQEYSDKAYSWASLLQSRSSECLFLNSSSQQHLVFDSIHEECHEIHLSKRQIDVVPVYQDREDAVARIPKNVSRFFLREERAVGIIRPVHLLKAAIRENEAKTIKYLYALHSREDADVCQFRLHPTSFQQQLSASASIHTNRTPGAKAPPPPESPFETYLAEKLEPPPPVVTCDAETGAPTLQSGRTVNYFAPMATGLAVGLNIFMTSGFIGKVILETLVDENYKRLALLVVTPFFAIVSQFLWDNLVSFAAQVFFPMKQMHENSLYYSGQASEPLPSDYPLPSFTVHMPCYKEGLHSVLGPSLESAMEAVQAYRALGGVANIVVSEDGMRLLKREEAEERIQYYESLGCGWVARPGHGADGYIRKGRFKKASNLNYTYNFSLEIEELMDEMRPTFECEGTAEEQEERLYQLAFQRAVEKSDGKIWASGNVRMGDYILLIDCDTRMKHDCLMEAAAEMERCPEVGALQHCSGVMYTRRHYFERFIGYFTAACINFSISWVCANGAMAPLMGHNVFLRWRAMQQVAFRDLDGERCVFSPHHVSEDFEMALKLQMKGYIVRWATYSDEGFTEGVSFTPEDEVTRYQKYAYGCSEIVFNPLKYWFTRGPLSKLFRDFLWSDVPLAYKISTLSYMSTYYALAVAFPLTLALFVIQGLFAPWLDLVFLPNFDVWITVTLIFTLAGGPGLIIARARCGHQTMLGAIKNALTHLPATIIFFSGLNFHIMTALFSHLFSIDMSWTTTNKDFTETSFTQLLKRFWLLHVTALTLVFAIVIATSELVPITWRIDDYRVLLPPLLMLSLHMLFPILLDPGMLHKYLPDIGGAREIVEEKAKGFFHAAGGRIKQVYDVDRGSSNTSQDVNAVFPRLSHTQRLPSSSSSFTNYTLQEKA